MRYYRSQIPKIASDIVQSLRKDGDIEVEDGAVKEAEQDVVAILDLYLKNTHEYIEEAKDILDRRGLGHTDLGRIKREVFEGHQHPSGSEAARWLATQIVECFMASRWVNEVFGEDQMLRRKILEIFKRHEVDEVALDREVKGRMKNLNEQSAEWSIEYQRIMREVRRKHGLH